MVSIKTIATLGLVVGAVLAFYRLGGAAGIGARIGGGLNSFGSAISSPFEGLFDTPPPQDQRGAAGPGTVGTVVRELNLGDATINEEAYQADEVTPILRERLAVAALADKFNREVGAARGITSRVDLSTGNFITRFTRSIGTVKAGTRSVQPLPYNSDGTLRTGGSPGLSPEVQRRQAELSARYGIATFNRSGAVTNLAGFTSGAV